MFETVEAYKSARISIIVNHAKRLGYHPREWIKAWGKLLEKRWKQDFGLVRSYRVMSLLNCMGKVVEKVVAKKLSQ